MTISPSQPKQLNLWRPFSGASTTTYPEQFWRSLFYFNIYQLVIASGIATVTWIFHLTSFGSYHYHLFLYAALGHVLFSSLSIILLKLRRPGFDWQLSLQVSSSIAFICVMMYASGGIQSGLGVLLLVSLAGAGLISRGKLALFFASIASLGVLSQETYSLLYIENYHAQYTQAGLLSMGYFAVAWLAHRLAIHVTASEQLARRRGDDLENMSKINQLVIQELQEGILVVDENGHIRQHNSYAEKLISLDPSDILEPPRLADYAPILATRLATWRGGGNINFDLLRLAGSNILVRTRFVPVKKNSRTGVVIFLEDMSHIQAQVQQLKLAALGRLTANIAHEIRNPLSAIGHAAELLEEEQAPTPVQPRLLGIIRDNTQRLNKIVQDVLQLNRRNIAQSEILDAKYFIHTFMADFCLTERIDIDTFILSADEQTMISFDSGHLNQILWNLCRNAWRHCLKKKGSIQLKLSRNAAESNINLDIIDDGPGISPILLRQLFEPFFTTAASGTGLGLYIARELCEANHASLDYMDNSTGGHFKIICKSDSDHA
ncbi:two-component system, NtrC family, sensor histidine kinase PilS [Nitrosomonas cryotolerans]|uniref:histidine kinase n=1 Tax=Nitrosomonas cryotolerans ATCC 49181 TaxID=1131553 RepID=A0A1N6J4N8_9PROT|nr:ATP-binding protein [Nitrosomonas cryotolerans]SFQ09841.1 two-component system, NtrC family, sensor histidine kinase PilS [Nitrosomonas cryotolerans]SIO39076.1 two-component system, NtrC family, sensor histidine kinase PilS [Nitrosomonas cryotolerans ATCC 49181]